MGRVCTYQEHLLALSEGCRLFLAVTNGENESSSAEVLVASIDTVPLVLGQLHDGPLPSDRSAEQPRREGHDRCAVCF